MNEYVLVFEYFRAFNKIFSTAIASLRQALH